MGGDVKYPPLGRGVYPGKKQKKAAFGEKNVPWHLESVCSARLSAGYVFRSKTAQGIRINNRFFQGGSTCSAGSSVAGLGQREVGV